MDINQTERLIAHLYCSAISGMQLRPLREEACPHWELTDKKKKRYVPLLIWGEAGVGKSETVKAVAEDLGIEVQVLPLGTMDQGDLMGLPRQEEVYPVVYDHQAGAPSHVLGQRLSKEHLLPYIVKNYREKAKGKRAHQIIEEAVQAARTPEYEHLISYQMVYSTPSWFPSPDTHGILFLDEISRSREDMRNSVFQLILDRRMHMLHLPDGWIVMAANNPMTNEYSGVQRSKDRAFQSRFCHVSLEPTVGEWLTYANATGVDPSIRGLITSSMVNSRGPSPKEILGLRDVTMPKSFPTPRTWVMLNNIMHGLDRDLILEVATGLVGASAAMSWATLRTMPDLPVTGEEILNTYAVLADGSAAPVTIRNKIYRFMDYPLPQFDDEGNPLLDEQKKQIMKKERRTDAVAITFDDLTSLLNDPNISPHQVMNLLAFLEDAFRLRDEVGAMTLSPQVKVKLKPRPGLGMNDIGYQYLKFWAELAGMARVLAQSAGLLRKALEESGQMTLVAKAGKAGGRRTRCRPSGGYGQLADAGVIEEYEGGEFRFLH